MKNINALAAVIIAAVAMISCVTNPAAPTTLSLQQQAINAGVASSNTLDQAVLATKAAYDAGKLSKADALKALAGFQAAETGLKTGVAVLSAATAASGSK